MDFLEHVIMRMQMKAKIIVGVANMMNQEFYFDFDLFRLLSTLNREQFCVWKFETNNVVYIRY